MPEYFQLEFKGPDGNATESYYAISKEIGVDHAAKTGYPKGMISHQAGASADGNTLVISEIWETKEDQEAFLADRLGPAIAAADEQPPTRAEWFSLLTNSQL